ncbi:MAG TPA: DapH/DapD/GlmU-related protein [Thermoplasmata archaeon]
MPRVRGRRQERENPRRESPTDPGKVVLIGEGIRIGEGVTFSPFVVIRGPAVLGKRVFIGEFTQIRERSEIGDDTRIGSHNQIQGDCVIGKECRFHSNVHISKDTRVGNRVFIAPGFVCANVRFPRAKHPELLKAEGCVIEDDVKIGTNVTLLPGVRIGENALVGAGAVVTKDVPAHSIVVGNPAKVVGDVRKLDAYR